MEHANETPTMLIGSNTVSGHRAKSKGPPTVEVSTDGTFLRRVPLKELTRFSKVAAAAFPRPEPSEKPANVGAAQSSKKQLDLHLNTFKLQPPEDAFDLAFEWMDNAKLTPRGNPLPDYCVPQPESLGYERLVDSYAAAVVLDIRPAPHKLRRTLLSCITEERPTRATLKYVHEHLPINDVVMTRFITSYFEHRDKSEYTREEQDEIELKYVCVVDPELHKRFKDIGNSRKARGNPRRRPAPYCRGQDAGNCACGGRWHPARGCGEQGSKGPHRGGKKPRKGRRR